VAEERNIAMRDKYSNFDDFTMFGFLANAMGGGGDRGQSFPQSDAEDLSRGLRFIPGEVTLARRRGERVQFVQDCQNPCCWYWQFPDGSRTYYWERGAYEQNGENEPCKLCGNENTKGGHITA
jgi:hypothetical protein